MIRVVPELAAFKVSRAVATSFDFLLTVSLYLGAYYNCPHHAISACSVVVCVWVVYVCFFSNAWAPVWVDFTPLTH